MDEKKVLVELTPEETAERNEFLHKLSSWEAAAKSIRLHKEKLAVAEEALADLTTHARRWEDKAEEYRAHAIQTADEIEATHAVLTDGNWPVFDEHEARIPLPVRVRMAMAPAAIALPEKLRDYMEKLYFMAHAMRTQDNASTAEPIFIVQQRHRLYGIDPDLVDDGEVVWLDCCNDYCEVEGDEAKALEEAYSETFEVPGEYQRTGYQDDWEFVQPFFTRVGAEAYIVANGHNLTDPRIYVDSAYRNREWQAVRAMLLDGPELVASPPERGPLDYSADVLVPWLRRCFPGINPQFVTAEQVATARREYEAAALRSIRPMARRRDEGEQG